MPKARKTTRSAPPRSSPSLVPAIDVDRLLGDVRALIELARERTAQAVNSAMVGLYWSIGKRIRDDVLQEKRAAYGEAIVSTLSKLLIAEYGRGYSKPNLSRMIWMAEAFPDPEIVSTLSKQLSWSHFVKILPLKDPLKRDFYAELSRAERWNVRTLRRKIGHLLYERTAVSKKPDELIAKDIAALRDEDRLTPDLVFRDPYFLDFLCLTGTPKKTSRPRSSGNWRRSSSSSEAISPSSPARNGFPSTPRTTTSTFCFTTGACAGWSRST